MASRKDEIFSVLKETNGLSDREITDILFGVGSPPQSVNSECRYQAQRGKLIRKKEDGTIRNYLIETAYSSERSQIVGNKEKEKKNNSQQEFKLNQDAEKIVLSGISFERVNIKFEDFNKENVFFRLNNKSVLETLNKPKYSKLLPAVKSKYPDFLTYSIGEFLNTLKEADDIYYLNFLNPYGDKKYCKFKITDEAIHLKGLYTYVVGKTIMYIGRCKDSFYKRINDGYGRISPKNCYLDGRVTNCHINSLVNDAGNKVELWIASLDDDLEIEKLEKQLIKKCNPKWNIALK